VALENGARETVSIGCEEDVFEAAASISARHALDEEASAELEAHLYARWLDGDGEEAPPYEGPTAADGELQGVVCSIELPDVGLVLEVADSLLGGGGGRAGLGLFVRTMEGVRDVRLSAGTAICGYAVGSLEALPDSDGGKTVAFALRQPSTSVFFERELATVSSCVGPDCDADTVAGHVLRRSKEGEVMSIELDSTWEGRRYFVPSSEQGELSIMNIGQFANDLAMPGAEPAAGYSSTSASQNVLVLVQRLERDPEVPTTLLPSRPITTLARDVTFSNRLPMELGCEYGARYWEAKDATEA